MRAVVQRVDAAQCEVEGTITGAIDQGLLVFLGVGEGDDDEDGQYLAEKIIGLRIFEDEQGKMNRSVDEIDGGILVIPQFTLYGDVRKGRRPSFHEAADPSRAEQLYESFMDWLRNSYDTVEEGRFGEMMEIRADNDGPVTILIDSEGRF